MIVLDLDSFALLGSHMGDEDEVDEEMFLQHRRNYMEQEKCMILTSKL